MAEADWDEVTYLRKKQQTAKQARSNKAVNSALRKGETVETRTKFSAASNKQHSGDKSTVKLDQETEELHHDKVSLQLGQLIQKGRVQKELTQKELATRINEKPQVINDYEAGRAIPNQQIISKIERIIGMKLRGKDKGKPLGGSKK
ncbi:endothelial differentiation-related factor 1-like [Asterias amurensis]|uniref:endothelial differentiation-related factor 1-like n=1 Tax=Asterias amurensis TaxID=7602 RepID=UPI001FC0F5A2